MRASARSQEMIGDVCPSASLVNSRATQSRSDDRAMYAPLGSLPGVPSSDGMITVNPASTTSSANFATNGVIPGISWTTTTPGPVPLR